MAKKFKNPWVQKFWRFSTSFQLGIPILVALSLLIISGTIVESKYDAFTAGKLVYQSWMMYVTLGLLVYNLMIVMVDRLPWKSNHYPFVIVHIGIITMIIGGWITQKFGVDGSMSIPLNGNSRYVMVADTDLVIYGTFDGSSYRKIYDQEVDFFNHPPSEKHPMYLELPSEDKIVILDYVKYGRVNKKIVAADTPQAGSSIKLQLFNANVKQVESLTQVGKNKPVSQQVGPLLMHYEYTGHYHNRKNKEKNEIYFEKKADGKIAYFAYDKNEDKAYLKGEMKIGDVLTTHWMGLQIRLLDYMDKAKEVYDVTPVAYPTPLTTSAVLVDYRGQKEWLLLNDRVLLFGDQQAYLVGYINRKIDIGFDINLKDFKVTNYQGSMKAMEYASTVEYEDAAGEKKQTVISMNEPLKFANFYFYQSSFEQDPNTGAPTASVLSVNRDPGRAVKYWGSILLSLGTVWLFYQRRKRRTAV